MSAHIELRSDTFTTPTPEMRRAMADAEVGDDEYGEDPTVNRLQSLVAGLLGTEASLYVPSGTMANQLAIRVLSRPGTEVLCPARSHVYQYELAASPPEPPPSRPDVETRPRRAVSLPTEPAVRTHHPRRTVRIGDTPTRSWTSGSGGDVPSETRRALGTRRARRTTQRAAHCVTALSIMATTLIRR